MKGEGKRRGQGGGQRRGRKWVRGGKQYGTWRRKWEGGDNFGERGKGKGKGGRGNTEGKREIVPPPLWNRQWVRIRVRVGVRVSNRVSWFHV